MKYRKWKFHVDFRSDEGSTHDEETPRTDRLHRKKHRVKNGRQQIDLTPPEKLLSKAEKKAKKYYKQKKVGVSTLDLSPVFLVRIDYVAILRWGAFITLCLVVLVSISWYSLDVFNKMFVNFTGSRDLHFWFRQIKLLRKWSAAQLFQGLFMETVTGN